MASLANGGFPTRLGFHLLSIEERVVRTIARKGWADRPGPAGLGLS
jgi:hypothetical protein